jgi:uncharacterized protein
VYRHRADNEATPDFTIPVDSEGKVVYFGINRRHFLLNGAIGSFHDELPAWAVKILSAMNLPAKEKSSEFRRLYRGSSGYDCKKFVEEMKLFKNGSHPELREEPRNTRFQLNKPPRVFTVYISHGCNLACNYCINRQGTFGGNTSYMTVDTARNVVNFITQIAESEQHEDITVNLYGGEPLLAPEAAYIIARSLQDLNYRKLRTTVHLLLATNGTIYNKKIFDVFAEFPRTSTVMVSLDGSRLIHDTNRPFSQGDESSYDSVIRTLGKMIRNTIPYSITCVVPAPYNYIAASEELHALGIRRLDIKQHIDHIYGSSPIQGAVRQDFEVWRQNYLAYTDYYLDYLGRADPVIHSDKSSALLNGLASIIGTQTDQYTPLACGIAETKIAIAADGVIVPCELFLDKKKFALGSVQAGFNNDNYHKFERWLFAGGQHRTDVTKCRNCCAKRICGGGCYAESFDTSGRLLPYEDSVCRMVKEKLMIDLYYISELKKRHPGIFSRFAGAPDSEKNSVT